MNDSWEQKASLPNGMQAASASAGNNFGYVGNGWWNSNGHLNFFKYDDNSNSWSSIANYIGNVTHDAVAVVLNNNLYAGLGAQPYSSNHWDDWSVYNIGTNTWASLSPFPGVDRRNAVSFVLNNEIYVGGGQPEGGASGNDFYKYVPSTDTWQAISSCPSNSIISTRNSSFTINGKVYLALNDGLWEYDPTDDSWLSYAMPFNGSVDAAFTLNNRGYIIKTGTQEVWEWAYCSQTTGIDVVASCNSYTWIDGNTYTSSNNSATYTLTNSSGCDSIVTLDLTINSSPSTQVTQNDDLLSANQTQAIYQWLDCDDNFNTIEGELNQFFSPENSGNYAVEVTVNGCSDTSECLLVDYAGIIEDQLESLNVYPNPASDKLTVSFGPSLIENSNYQIVNIYGQVVSAAKLQEGVIDISQLPSGVYVLNIINNGGLEAVKFVKK